jgi:hypothetical protein
MKVQIGYSSTLSSTSALDGGGWLMLRTSRFTTGNNPWYRRQGASHGRTGQGKKILPPPGFDPRAVEPVASLYTDWYIPAHRSLKNNCSNKRIRREYQSSH